MPQYEGTEILTIDKAEQAKRVAEEWFIDKIGFQESELPVLYQPGHEGPMWVLSLEGGPEDWTIMLSHNDTVKWPDGVFVEPVNSWCLGLYPARRFHVKRRTIMDDEQYMTHLYDRGAQRLGYASYEVQRADMDATLKQRHAKAAADERADRAAWGKAQLSG